MPSKSKKLDHKKLTNTQTKLNQIKHKICVDHLCNCEECQGYTVTIPRKYLSAKKSALLIGSPNVGKSTLFNKITTSIAPVSNIDRMTVDSNCGFVKKHKDQILVDLPGLYNLSHPIDEELVVTNMLMKNKYSSIVNVIGATSLQRDLYLAIQCAETGMLSTIVINAIDEVNQQIINFNKLSKKLSGVNIVPSSAFKGYNVDKVIDCVYHEKLSSDKPITYSKKIENYINQITKVIPSHQHLSKRFIALMLLEGNGYVHSYCNYFFPKEYKKLDKLFTSLANAKLADEIKKERVIFINQLISECIIETKNLTFLKVNKLKKYRADGVLLRKWIGIPLTLLLISFVYFIAFGPWTGYWLQSNLNDVVLTDWIGNNIQHGLVNWWGSGNVATWFSGLFVDGVLGGFFTVLSFSIPIVILFILVNLIQQVGIISRISALLDQTFERFGLSGRSFVNLMTGFGCNVPAIMMARSSNNKKERIVSILITPFVSCSARAIVYSFVCNAIFGNHLGWLAMVLLMVFSGLVALGFGLVFSKTMFRKQKSFFFIEMVNWRKPDLLVLTKNVWAQLVDFVKKAATWIVLANVLVWLLLHLGPTGLLNDDQIDTSLIAEASRGINYLMYPMGGTNKFSWIGDQDNGWKLMTSLISAFPAKEIALSNLALLFPGENSFANTIGMYQNMPLGISYLLMLMFYLPCASTIIIIKKEGGWKLMWMNLFAGLFTSYFIAIIGYWIAYAIIFL